MRSCRGRPDLPVSYAETPLSQVLQTVACNALHTTEEPMCRWPMMHHRAAGGSLAGTHEFLSNILGAIQILDRGGTERASFACYAIVKARCDAFLNPPPTAVQKTKSGRTQTT